MLGHSGLAVVKYVGYEGSEHEYQGVVTFQDGKVWAVARKGKRKFEICDEGQVYSLEKTNKHR
jgi:hypothetical protein